MADTRIEEELHRSFGVDADKRVLTSSTTLFLATNIWCEHRLSNDEAQHRVLEDSRLLTEIFALRCLRWLRHVLRMPVHRLIFRALFAHVGLEEAIRRSGYQLAYMYEEVNLRFGLRRCLSPSWWGRIVVGWRHREIWLRTEVSDPNAV